MASSRWLPLAFAQALVAAGVLIAYAAARHDLPANALLAGLVAGLAGAWIIARLSTAERSAPGPTAEAAQRLDDERQRRTLQAFLDQAPTPLVALRPGGALVAVNRAARRLFRTDAAVADREGALYRAIEAATPARRSRVRLTAQGVVRTYALAVAEVASVEGRLKLVVLTDIQADIQAAEAAALKALLQVLSHEIMNSLTPLASLAQTAHEVLEEGGPDSLALARDSIGVVARRTEGLQRFVESYRQLARLPDPAPRETSLAALLSEAARLFAVRWAAEAVTLTLEAPEPDVIVRLDPDLTSQALTGLLTNAAQAALDGAPPARVWLTGRAVGDGVEISVRDSGAGVPAEIAGRIFGPFFTTKPDGSGVGLTLAHQAIAIQGGELELEPSIESQGARFSVRM